MRRRIGTAFALAAAVGLLAALLSGMAFDPSSTIGKWGIGNGAFAAGIVFLVVLGRGTRWPGMLARWLLVAVLAVAAYAISWWTVASGTSLWSLEGAWLWPLTLAALGTWVLALRWAWRRRSGDQAGEPFP